MADNAARKSSFIYCGDCEAKVPRADAEWIQGTAYCDDCWPDHADEDYPDDSQQ